MIKNIKINRSLYIFGSILFGVITAAIITSLLPASKASALAANPASTYITESTDFYAYVNTDENLDASFIKQIDTSGVNDTDAVFTVSRPGAADQVCTVLANDPVSSSCDFTNQTATQSGIWRISFVHGFVTINDQYTWTIGVQTGSTDIPGRVWSSVYNVSQLGGAPPTGVNFSAWYQSEFGYLYKATNFDYNGIQSAIQGDALGLVKSGGGCVPLYKSVNRNDLSYAFPAANCASTFKTFFEVPASDLPVSATKWDGSTDWIKSPITPPSITGLSFTSGTDSRDGNINITSANYRGAVNLGIDTNGNGVYTDPVDVHLLIGMINGVANVVFNGKDGLGNTIPTSQPINFKATIDHAAEIHFLATDVELRGSGVEVIRQNGPAGNESTIYWDDTKFPSPDANRCSITPDALDATAGVDSTGGVHSWSLSGCGGPQFGNFNNNVNGSWGDSRIINEWAFVPSNASKTFVLSAHTVLPASIILADTGDNTHVLIALSLAFVIVPSAILTVIKKQYLH